jgi:UDP-2-acetamido-3-amino-2,3-dideoxy-glucuronate N-acetyltransferase
MTPKIAVVGMGYWGKHLVRNFAELGALQIVCDEQQSRAEAVHTNYPGVAFTAEYPSLLQDRKIDAVVIATPATMHYRMARLALEAGKHVFVEKPLALDVNEGASLVAAAARGSRILMVGHVLQYHPAVIKIKALIAEGELGQLQYLYSHRLNIGKIRSEENILWSFAPHDISVMLSLINEEPCQVTSQGAHYLNASVADVTTSEFAFPSGVHAHIFVSWLNPFKEQRLVVVGAEKMVVFDDTAREKLMLYPHRIEWRNGTPQAIKAEGVAVSIDSVEPLRSECQHFLNCVSSHSRPLSDGIEGLKVLKVLAACQRALDSRETVPAAGANRTPAMEERMYAAPPFCYVHPTAIVDEPCEIGEGTKIWHFSHVMKNVEIGKGCVIGQNCNIAEGVRVGDNVKVQNNVSIYTGTVVEDDVFLGPSCVLTNVTNPRSQINRHALYESTILRRGATVGANATILCGVEIGRYSFIAAGAVVTRNVPDYALMTGNPARQKGWMSRHGHRLLERDGVMVCPETGLRYQECRPGTIRCLDLDEEAALPPDLATGTKSYREWKQPLRADRAMSC